MTEQQRIEIPRSKAKSLLGLAGSLLLVALSIWLLYVRHHFGWPKRLVVIAAAIAGIAFFGFCAVVIVRNFFNSKPGLVVDADGVTDSSSMQQMGLIPWADIIGLAEWQYNGQKMVVLILHEPQCYIDKVPNALQRKTLLFNLNKCGSPVVISANNLKISHNDLYALLQQKLDEHHTGVSG